METVKNYPKIIKYYVKLKKKTRGTKTYQNRRLKKLKLNLLNKFKRTVDIPSTQTNSYKLLK
jgi:hypothetical protein